MMLQRIVAFALSQRLFVILSVLLLIGAGAVVLPSLPIDAFPDVSPVQVKIIMKAPGLTPEEVEQRITVPVELELLGLPNKKILRSATKYALADITSISRMARISIGRATRSRNGCPTLRATFPKA